MTFSSTGKIVVAALAAAALSWVAARGIPGGNSARLAALESGQKEILKEVQGLKAVMQRGAPPPANQAPPAPPPLPVMPIAIDGAAARGRSDARLTLIEFSDFQCPFCARHTRETFAQIQREYVDTGKVRYVFRHFPIESIHPNAFAAARAAECARQQGKFWDMHTRLFANQQQLAETDLVGYAKAAGLDTTAFQRCVATAEVSAKIRQDLDEGARAGISGTPMFFVGTVEGGKVRVLRRLNGAVPFAAFKTALDALLASPNPAPSPSP